MKKCNHPLEIAIITTSHDIHIYDIFHDDNAITITKDEARYLIPLLIKVLENEK